MLRRFLWGAAIGAVGGYFGGRILGGIYGAYKYDRDHGGSSCFVRGTLVATKGGLVPIETLKMGDKVCSMDVASRCVKFEAVIQTINSQSSEFVVLGLQDETIRCTPQHRFYTNRWVAAGELVPGDSLLSREGREVKLLTVRQEEEMQSVFNLMVANSHNYFVGKSELLVHNLKINDVGEGTDEEDESDDEP